MGKSVWAIAQKAFSDQGVKSVAALALKKVVQPVAKVGSLYFLERDLSAPMPPLQPVKGILTREASFADLHLLDAMDDTVRRKEEAVDRLKRGDHWFVGIETATGKLTNHRWVSMTRGFIPELDRDVIVKPGQAYIYDLETLPEFRRRGLDAVTRQYTYETLLRKYGAKSIIVYIRADNHASLRAGRQYLSPACRVWYARIGRGVQIFSLQRDRMPELKPAVRQPLQAAFFARPSSSLR